MEKQKALARLEEIKKKEKTLLDRKESQKKKIANAIKAIQNQSNIRRKASMELANVEKALQVLQVEKLQNLCVARGIDVETLLEQADRNEPLQTENDAAKEEDREMKTDDSTEADEDGQRAPDVKASTERDGASASYSSTTGDPSDAGSELFDRFAKIRAMYK